MAYVVSAHKPTSVRHALLCSFLSPNSHTLILACSNFLQILEYDETGQLIPVAEHSLHERIIGLAVHKPPHYGGQDHLFILTDNKVAFTCSWDLETQSLRNERVIEGLADSALRPSEASERVRLDPGNRVIGLNLYQGLLTFILIHQHVPIKGRKSLTSNIPENTILEAVSLRTRVLNLANFVFLKTDGVYPYIAVLWKDNELKRFLSLWEIDKLYKAGDRDFVEHRWANGEKNVLVDRGANLLIPTANGGVVVVGEQTIAYYSVTLDTFQILLHKPTIFETYTTFGEGNDQWILGDSDGHIYSLSIQDGESFIFDKLGESSIPSALAALDPFTLFIGSHFADSLTVTLHPTLSPKQTVITNLAPISDFLVLPPSHPQAGTIITCSGGFGQGTLRVVRQGVGIEDYAAVDFEGIRGLWTLPTTVLSGMHVDGQPYDGVLVLGLLERTVFLEMDAEGGLEAVDRVAGLIDFEETIALKEVGGTVIQITTEQVHVTSQNLKVAGVSAKISAAQITNDKILISSGRNLSLLNFQCQSLHEWTLPQEITCLDINGDLIIVGLWNSNVQIISLSDNSTTQLDSALSAPARSIIFSNIFNTLSMFIGSRDGTLTSYSLADPSSPSEKKTVSLGTQPLHLFPLNTPTRDLIFASSDRPTLLHVPSKDRSKKLVISALSLKDVLSLTPLQHPAYPEALVLATKEGFRIGKMDQMARLQVRSVGMPNGELPRRIARLDGEEKGGSSVVAVISLKLDIDVDGSEKMHGYLRVWDEDTWQCLDMVKLQLNEVPDGSKRDLPQAIAACKLLNVSTDERKWYFVMGSAVEKTTEDEPDEGYIRVYEVVQSGARRRLNMCAELKVAGSVYCVDECDGKLVAGVKNTLRVYDLTHDSLSEVAVYRAPITALTVATRSPFVLLGDLINSVTLLRLDSLFNGNTEIVTVARDYAPLWMTSVAMIDESWYIGAEDSGNLAGWKRDDDPTADKSRLVMVNEMRFGELINRIRLGVVNNSEIPGVEMKALFATVDGTIGIVSMLSEERFAVLEQLEHKMEEQDMSLGGLEHSRWRAFTNERKKSRTSKGFIDGDFVEGFLDLDPERRAKCCESIKCGFEEVQRLVEELSRLH